MSSAPMFNILDDVDRGGRRMPPQDPPAFLQARLARSISVLLMALELIPLC